MPSPLFAKPLHADLVALIDTMLDSIDPEAYVY